MQAAGRTRHRPAPLTSRGSFGSSTIVARLLESPAVAALREAQARQRAASRKQTAATVETPSFLMLRNYIEDRERFFHARDANRTSLPFELGLEHLGLQPDVNFETALRDYVSRAVSDSPSFYAYRPTKQYMFDGHILRFPSGVETAYPENNTAWGRFFRGTSDLAMAVLPQWNCKWDGQLSLCRVLQAAQISSLRLSLPYHHYRRPAHLERSEYLVSPNIGRTVAAVRQAVLDSRRAADWLFGCGYRRVGILGTSVGSCIGFLALAHDERFSAGVFIHVSSFFADVFWMGLFSEHVLRSLDSAIAGYNIVRFLTRRN